MKTRILTFVLALLALLIIPAAASAKLTVGIGENSPGMFSDPLFSQLGAKHSRVVVSWNVVAKNDDELLRVGDYLEGARVTGVTPLVTFEHGRGDATICNKKKNRKKAQCVLPKPKQYEAALRAFKARFPTVRSIVPWNEVNHFTQPTSRNPKAAARFTKIARKVFKGSTVMDVDMLDQANNPSAKRPKFTSLARYAKRFTKALGGKRKICGIHNYSDINRFRTTGTKAIMKGLKCKQYWLTEVGGIYQFGPFKASQKRQLKATKFMFKSARKNKKVTRLYVYTWFGGVTSRFDAGLVAGGKARSSYAVVRKNTK